MTLCVTDCLFKLNNLMNITPVYHHNLARSLHCYVTTRTSLTFSIYLWAMYIVYNRWLYVWLFKFNNLIDITPTQSQLGEKFILLRYNANMIDLFKLSGSHMHIVYNRWLYVWLFKFNNSMDITPTQYHNLAWSLYC